MTVARTVDAFIHGAANEPGWPAIVPTRPSPARP
jgi:hypothetical protein